MSVSWYVTRHVALPTLTLLIVITSYSIHYTKLYEYYNMEYCHPVFGRFNYLFFDSWVEGYSDSGVAAAILDDTDYFIKCAYHKNDNSNITYFCMYSSYEMIYLRYSGGKTPEEVIEAIEYALIV